MRAVRHLITTDELQARTRTPLANFVRDLDCHDLMAMGTLHWQVTRPRTRAGYTASRRPTAPAGQTRLDNLKELTQSMQSFETLQAYLNTFHWSWTFERRDENADGGSGSVQIMTLHGARLEFTLVFLPVGRKASSPASAV